MVAADDAGVLVGSWAEKCRPPARSNGWSQAGRAEAGSGPERSSNALSSIMPNIHKKIMSNFMVFLL